MTTATTSATGPGTYTVGEAAERTGFSVDTLRYYEREGLLDRVERTHTGRRRYTDDDLGWLELLHCLRDTGMSIGDMRRFAELIRAGDHTNGERADLLEAHRDRARARIARLHEQLRRVDAKIDYYRGASA